MNCSILLQNHDVQLYSWSTFCNISLQELQTTMSSIDPVFSLKSDLYSYLCTRFPVVRPGASVSSDFLCYHKIPNQVHSTSAVLLTRGHDTWLDFLAFQRNCNSNRKAAIITSKDSKKFTFMRISRLKNPC
ncbi:hypothetical protein GEMRC1_012080 [Eukaryota sp. GEM-RC1]